MAHPWPLESTGHPYVWRRAIAVQYYTDAPKATGATAGTPGVFTGGTGKVNTLVDMTGVVASPATNWTIGQRMLLNDGTEAYWNGTAWIAGRHP